MDIRRSTPDDFETLWHCVDEVARERRFLAMTEAPPLDQSRAFLQQAHANGMIQFVAMQNHHIVGWCDVAPIRWQGFRHSGRLGLGVREGWRGQGIGSRLLSTTVEAATAAGLTRVELEVFKSNYIAIALYERHGFVVEGVKRHARVLDGDVDDMVCMARIVAR